MGAQKLCADPVENANLCQAKILTVFVLSNAPNIGNRSVDPMVFPMITIANCTGQLASQARQCLLCMQDFAGKIEKG